MIFFPLHYNEIHEKKFSSLDIVELQVKRCGWKLCVVTVGKTSFSAISSAELFLLNDLLLSAVGLTGLPVLELFTFKKKLFTLFAIADSSFSVLFLLPV